MHEHRDENAFIFALVQLLTKHGTTLDEVKELFRSQTSECAMEPMDNGEFDLMIRFVDSEDPYYYCFKDEGCHIIYHFFRRIMQISDSKRRIIGCKISEMKQKVDILEKI